MNSNFKHTLKMMILSSLFAALTAVGAFLHVPLGFTSITLQAFFTCLAGVLLGPLWGTVSQALYVAIGLIGFPIFTQGGGLGYLVQPSMGFLFGLIPMAFVVGILSKNAFQKERKWGWLQLLGALLAGEVVLYLVGLPYMAGVLNIYLQKGYAFAELLSFGCLVYLPGDAVKILCVELISFPLHLALQKAKMIQ